MKGIIFSVLITSMFVFVAPVHAQICKWVDDEGVTHYETECPDQDTAEVLEINTTPSEESVDEGQQATEQSQQEFAALQQGEDGRAEIGLAPAQPSVLQDAEARANCVRATTNLMTLQMQAPVFYDAQGELHHGWSNRARAYEGPRTYVDDGDRASEIRRYEDYLADNCGQTEAEREQLAELVAEQNLQTLQDEICAEREYLLDRLNSGLTGLPSPAVRELQAYIRENCN